MAMALPPIHAFARGSDMTAPGPTSAFSLDTLAGRLSEVSGQGACPTSFVFLLVEEAQRAGKLALWLLVRPLTSPGTELAAPFLAEDLAHLDLCALPLVLAHDLHEAGRAATHVLRSGAFALVVVDLLDHGSDTELPLPLISRLHGLAQKHGTALVALTAKPSDAPSLGALVAYRAHITRHREPHPHEDGHTRFQATLSVIKDKRHGPGRTLTRTFRGPPGLVPR